MDIYRTLIHTGNSGAKLFTLDQHRPESRLAQIKMTWGCLFCFVLYVTLLHFAESFQIERPATLMPLYKPVLCSAAAVVRMNRCNKQQAFITGHHNQLPFLYPSEWCTTRLHTYTFAVKNSLKPLDGFKHTPSRTSSEYKRIITKSLSCSLGYGIGDFIAQVFSRKVKSVFVEWLHFYTCKN